MDTIYGKNSDSKHDKIVDTNLIIPLAGNDFYRIGLSLFPFGSSKRKLFYNPFLVFVTVIGFSLKILVSIFMIDDQSDPRLALILGDWQFFLPKQIRYHITIAQLLYGFTAIVTQLIHFWYYANDISPKYLKPFQMASGLMSPKDIGLTHTTDVHALLRQINLTLKCTEFLRQTAIPSAILVSGVPLAMNATFGEFVFLVIPGVFIYTCYVLFSAGFLVYQIAYFHIICFYLRLKLKRINHKLRKVLMSSEMTNINIFGNLNAIHKEIIGCNDNFWSEYLLWIFLHHPKDQLRTIHAYNSHRSHDMTDVNVDQMRGIFDNSQHLHKSQKCLSQMQDLYHKYADSEELLSDFAAELRRDILFTLNCDPKSPFTKHTIEFVANFLRSFSAPKQPEDTRLEDTTTTAANGDDTTATDADDTIIDEEMAADDESSADRSDQENRAPADDSLNDELGVESFGSESFSRRARKDQSTIGANTTTASSMNYTSATADGAKEDPTFADMIIKDQL
ncbi:unnamed protein product, partial [Medioppia subpectinata]